MSNLEQGLGEMRRVTRGRVVILTCDPDVVRDFWLFDYVPEVLETEARRYPSLPRLSAALGGNVKVLPVPIPKNCFDGFNEAYYARPEMFLRAPARLACSAWSFVPEQVVQVGLARLQADLADGTWEARYGALRHLAHFQGSLRMVVGEAHGESASTAA